MRHLLVGSQITQITQISHRFRTDFFEDAKALAVGSRIGVVDACGIFLFIAKHTKNSRARKELDFLNAF